VAWYQFGARAQQAAALREETDLRLQALRGLVEQQALVAAASPAVAPAPQYLRTSDRWQQDVWRFYDTEGEFNYGVQWLAAMLSRVRLRAARMVPGSDEPELEESGPAADLIARLGNGVGGQSEIMKRLTVQLSVPGEGYLIGETLPGEQERWTVRSVEEIRAGGRPPAQGGSGYQVVMEDAVNTGMVWRDLAPESVPVRIWRPHDRYYHLADSPARSAMSILRELELVNRYITAQYLSRLASAGAFIIPDEASFPVREEFADEEDPFSREWIEMASTAIKTPGSASAAVPFLFRMPAELIKDVKFIDFTVRIDDKIIERRDSVVKRLATKLDLPSDVLLGLGDSNHWNAWAGEEEGLQAHIAPTAEVICHSLTYGYLRPGLLAMKEDPSDWVVWYDMSELTIRPDRSTNAVNLYDRMELSGKALRRETGFAEEDLPNPDELKDILLKTLVRTAHGAAPGAVDVLVGTQIVTPATIGPGAAQQKQGIPSEPGQTPDEQQEQPAPVAPAPAGPANVSKTPPAAPPQPRAATSQRRALQSRTQHVVVLKPGTATWDLRHPAVCAGHADSCPFTAAVRTDAPAAVPGSPGAHFCRLDAFGVLRIDAQAPFVDTASWTSTVLLPRSGARSG
jgi:hypothetical protein